MKPYERNRELESSFVQGWYLPDELASEILKNFLDLDELQYSNNVMCYYGTQFSNISEEIQNKYFSCLNELVLKYENTYEGLKKLNYKLNKEINLQYWKPNEHFFKWHCEIDNHVEFIYRNLVFMTYLNNVTVGGETEFVYQNCKIQPKRGLTVIWPANWTHRHRGCMTEENKYAITGWFELVPEREDLHLNIPNRDQNTINYG